MNAAVGMAAFIMLDKHQRQEVSSLKAVMGPNDET